MNLVHNICFTCQKFQWIYYGLNKAHEILKSPLKKKNGRADKENGRAEHPAISAELEH